VIKDNLKFGIKEVNAKEHYGEEVLDNELKDSIPNPSKLWLDLGEECKLLIEMKLAEGDANEGNHTTFTYKNGF